MKINKFNILLVGVLIGALGGATVSSAAVQSTAFYACLKSGSLSAITTVDHACKKGFVKVSWNSQGVQGLQGVQGPAGEQGERGPVGPKGNPGSSSFTEFVSDSDGAIRYKVVDYPSVGLVDGKLAEFQLDGQVHGKSQDWLLGFTGSHCTGTPVMAVSRQFRDWVVNISGSQTWDGDYVTTTQASNAFETYQSFYDYGSCYSRAQSGETYRYQVESGNFWNLSRVEMPAPGPLHYEY